MISVHDYKYAQKCLYKYKENERQLEEYQSELEYIIEHGDLRVQSYQGIYGSSGSQDQVMEYVHTKQHLEDKLKELTRAIYIVRTVYRRLQRSSSNESMKLLLVLEEIYLESSRAREEVSRMDEKEVSHLKYKLCNKVAKELMRYHERYHEA